MDNFKNTFKKSRSFQHSNENNNTRKLKRMTSLPTFRESALKRIKLSPSFTGSSLRRRLPSFSASSYTLNSIFPALLTIRVKFIKTLHLRRTRTVFNVYTNNSRMLSIFSGSVLCLVLFIACVKSDASCWYQCTPYGYNMPVEGFIKDVHIRKYLVGLKFVENGTKFLKIWWKMFPWKQLTIFSFLVVWMFFVCSCVCLIVQTCS